jgi:Txe/YoeB family toxin of Txe-Axe toxin-antitoxin module
MNTYRGKALEKQIRKNPQLGPIIVDLEAKIAPLTRQQMSAGGFQLEPIKHSNGALWSLRVGRGPRMVCRVQGETLELIELESHQGAYRHSSLVMFTAGLLQK